MGSISNIPLKEKYQICLLCLNPGERTGTFLYEDIKPEDRCIFEVHPDAGLIGAEVHTLQAGGTFECSVVTETYLVKGLVLQAQRTVKQEYESWDNLGHADKLHLQRHWVMGMLKRTEEDLIRAVDHPHTNPTTPRYNTVGIYAIINRLDKLEGELDGLKTALDSM